MTQPFSGFNDIICYQKESTFGTVSSTTTVYRFGETLDFNPDVTRGRFKLYGLGNRESKTIRIGNKFITLNTSFFLRDSNRLLDLLRMSLGTHTGAWTGKMYSLNGGYATALTSAGGSTWYNHVPSYDVERITRKGTSGNALDNYDIFVGCKAEELRIESSAGQPLRYSLSSVAQEEGHYTGSLTSGVKRDYTDGKGNTIASGTTYGTASTNEPVMFFDAGLQYAYYEDADAADASLTWVTPETDATAANNTYVSGWVCTIRNNMRRIPATNSSGAAYIYEFVEGIRDIEVAVDMYFPTNTHYDEFISEDHYVYLKLKLSSTGSGKAFYLRLANGKWITESKPSTENEPRMERLVAGFSGIANTAASIEVS